MIMGKGLSKRDRENNKKRDVARAIKAAVMKRGDEMRTQRHTIIPELPQKPISSAKAQKLKLENLTSQQLKFLIEEKCMYSKIYYKEGIEASIVTPFNFNNFRSDYGLKLDFEKSDGREHYFGFELLQTNNGNIIRVHYAKVREDGVNFMNETYDINPKKFSARKLVDMVGEYR